jgi:hypothetical protein
MSILDVTEDQIFQTLGKGKDPNFKPIEKVRPVTIKPKKTYILNTNSKNINAKTMPAVKSVQPIETPVQQVIITAPSQTDETVKKLTEDLNELNNRVGSIQKMVKWYMVPQFVVILILILVLVVQAYP